MIKNVIPEIHTSENIIPKIVISSWK